VPFYRGENLGSMISLAVTLSPDSSMTDERRGQQNSAAETLSCAARLVPHDSRVTRRTSRKYSD
jgi:hypothetical protein